MPPSVRTEPFEEFQAEWEKILPDCCTNNIFLTPWWQRVWWRRFGEESELRILSVRDDGAVLGIAPLMLSDDRTLRFLGGSDLFDYHDFLVTKGNELSFFGALLDYLSTTDWNAIDLRSVPEGSPTIDYLPSLAEQRGYTVEVSEEDVTPRALLPPTWDEYVAHLSKKNRHELRRKLRRLEKEGVNRQYICDGPEALPECMQDFFRLHRASSPEKAEFMTPQREEFFMDAAMELGARGQFRLAFLELDGVRVASSINIDYRDSYFLYNSGYDPAYSSLSVGLLNKVLDIKGAIEAGKRSFDFLRGAERYKYHLGAKDYVLYRLVVRR